jgi:hypothetical protein
MRRGREPLGKPNSDAAEDSGDRDLINVVHYALDYDFKYNNGMPVRYVAVPFPPTGQPRAVDVGYVTGKDMLTSQPNPGAIRVVVTGGKIQTTWFVTDFGLRRGIKIDDWA